MTSSMLPNRGTLRSALLDQREHFMAGPQAERAERSMLQHLRGVLTALEPQCLGLYWPQRSEFNAAGSLLPDSALADLPLALPFAERSPTRLHYRAWDGRAPDAVDGCGIPTSSGPPTVPDVVLVPCVGFTEAGFRLGYGGGYFDRWLAAQAHVTAVGIAWSGSMVDEAVFVPQPHDLPLTLIVTEHGVVS